MRTEFEHRFDDAVDRHLPKPGPGGFTRGCFIGFRRDDRWKSDPSKADTKRLDNFYDVTSKVGEGGFACVHSAVHRRTGEVVAIKKIEREKVPDPEMLKAEVSFLKLADHPNVVRYYETMEDEHYHYLIMEMCSGGPLSKHIEMWHENNGAGLEEKDLARIVIQVLRGLAYCHAHSIVHRDVKPQNLLFGCGSPQNGNPLPLACSGHYDAPLKLLDFGISGVVRQNAPEKRLLTRRAGTEGYMAPEVLGGQPYGPMADMFSLGAVMATIIAGRAPEWLPEKRVYKFPGKVRWTRLSPGARALLERLLDPDPAARPTAAEASKDPWFEAMDAKLHVQQSEGLKECVENMVQFSRRSKLQRSIMYSMVAFAPLHNRIMERLRINFLRADTHLKGGITIDDFRVLVEGFRHDVDVERCFAAVNASQNGVISYSEFLAAAAPQQWFNESLRSRRAFDTLDVDRNGYIAADDLCHLFANTGDVQQISDEIRSRFPARTGRLSFDDFCSVSRQL